MLKYINIHTHKSNYQPDIKAIVNLNPSDLSATQLYSYGIHPWNIVEGGKLLDKFDLKKPASKQCIAIGEIGIDRSIATPIEEQISWFTEQVKLAKQYNKPIIIHCVKAYADFLQIRKHEPATHPWIFHGFNANIDIAKKLLQTQCYLSFGEHLTHSEKLQNTFKQIPISQIFLETDDSNVPIENIYETARKLLNMDLLALKLQMEENFAKVF